ncbi:hypothetical protein EW146_g1537 [Bondarzewia mesenterica]|uniref:Uncharacterized protein n=1 Tax=Bondarzewia mesenterica TaxID=1095465 RepID=A0A4S4M3K5_9AGAM|nr:hypothetical protein EW146_g1537 [Bondarzewia mesenterica]
MDLSCSDNAPAAWRTANSERACTSVRIRQLGVFIAGHHHSAQVKRGISADLETEVKQQRDDERGIETRETLGAERAGNSPAAGANSGAGGIHPRDASVSAFPSNLVFPYSAPGLSHSALIQIGALPSAAAQGYLRLRRTRQSSSPVPMTLTFPSILNVYNTCSALPPKSVSRARFLEPSSPAWSIDIARRSRRWVFPPLLPASPPFPLPSSSPTAATVAVDGIPRHRESFLAYHSRIDADIFVYCASLEFVNDTYAATLSWPRTERIRNQAKYAHPPQKEQQTQSSCRSARCRERASYTAALVKRAKSGTFGGLARQASDVTVVTMTSIIKIRENWAYRLEESMHAETLTSNSTPLINPAVNS